MKSEDREADRRERAENYQRGFVALKSAVDGFRELTGIDLLDTVDTAGRHMGEAPYLKITAERLVEIAETMELSARIGALVEIERNAIVEPAAVTNAQVLPFVRPVLSARRPGLVTS
jgi:hypothetical protein